MMDRMICELKRVNTSDSNMEFEGYGAVFGNKDSHGDVIQPGAFADFLASMKSGEARWPAMLSQHGGLQLTAQDMMPIGVWTDIKEDEHGLKVVGVLADTERGIEHYKLMKMMPRAPLDGLSIGYYPKAYDKPKRPEDPKRLLTKIDLVEISPVTRGSNVKALVTGVKSALDMTERQIEQTLRDALGLSSSEAKTVIGHGFKHLLKQRDAGEGELAEIAAMLRKNQLILKGS